MVELSDWEKELISQYGGDDDTDTAQDGAATDDAKAEETAGAPSVAAEGAPLAAAPTDATATPAPAADTADAPAPTADAAVVPTSAADAAPATAAASEGGLQAEVVALRSERETLNTLIAQWQTSVKNLEEKVWS